MSRIIFINLIIVALLFVILELSLKFIFNVKPLGISDGIINSNNPHIRFNFKGVKEGKIFGVSVYTDDDGFRVVENYSPKRNELKKVFFVGGSVTFGSGIKQKFTFSGLLNSKYKSLNIYNASVMGSDLGNNYSILKKIIKKDNIDKIFINFSFDDIQKVKIENLDKNSEFKKENFFSLNEFKEINLFKNINTYLRSRSVIYVYIKGFIFNTREYYYQNALDSYSYQKNIDIIDEVFEKIKKISNNSAEVIFIKIPYYSQILEKNCKTSDAGEMKIIEKFKEYDFKFIDFKPVFCSQENKDKIFLNFDASHLSSFGHRIVAENLYKFLD